MISHQEMQDIVATEAVESLSDRVIMQSREMTQLRASIHASAAEIIAAVKGQKSYRASRIRNHARFILEKTEP